MSHPVVLISDPLPTRLTAELNEDFEIRQCTGSNRAALLAAVPEAEALIIRSATRVDQEVLDHAPRLRIIARAGVGLDNVDVDAATRAGVMVVNAPVSNVTSVAELTVGLILSMFRHLPAAHASVRAGEWRRADFQGSELSGKSIGILGFGRIGQLVAERLAPFEVELLTHDPNVTAEFAFAQGVGWMPLDELMSTVDVLTVHVPRTPATTGLIGARELALAKPSLRVVNTSRGGIVDETALASALAAERIAGAALDVFETEPPTHSPLPHLDSVVCTPHIGAGTREAQDRAASTVLGAVRNAFLGLPVGGLVNPAATAARAATVTVS
ncbi:hydroxyacid dehydrogenase [Streptomyces sp. B-S-A8]|uniref:Hydroxyacid dehydrogenase n=1 Tax=Streptomyces solicavernae TaxID=3043614 RepID=A0ABT6RZV7_9ACTN|nr:hydroxyacid dehydrogenase [Streptomyces sp. B-S-A8]MDI3389969.1 hydroxyacid dehydrogenase [Streptomyces sp. B-S-A8]